MCYRPNYKVQGNSHSIHHHLEVAHIFHTLTDLADESVCVCQGEGCGNSRTPAKVCFIFSKLFSEMNILSYGFIYFFHTPKEHVCLLKSVCDMMGCEL